MKKIIAILILIIIVGLGVYKFKKDRIFRNSGSINTKEEVITGEKVIKEETDFYKISAEYPVESLDVDGVIEGFVEQQIKTKKKEWEVGGDAYNTEKEVERQYPDRPKMTYELNIFYDRFESKKMGTVSYLFRISEYTGGANANEIIQAFTFGRNGLMDIESFIDISDYQINGNEKIPNDIAVSQKILEAAKVDRDKVSDLDMVSDGLGLSYLKADGVSLDHEKCNCDGFFYGSNLQNFVVTDNGLIFYFDKGEIAARAVGVVGITLTWEELKPFTVKR